MMLALRKQRSQCRGSMSFGKRTHPLHKAQELVQQELAGKLQAGGMKTVFANRAKLAVAGLTRQRKSPSVVVSRTLKKIKNGYSAGQIGRTAPATRNLDHDSEAKIHLRGLLERQSQNQTGWFLTEVDVFA